MKVYFDVEWVIERDNGETVRLSRNESSLLYSMMRRRVIWDEVDMRLWGGEPYESHRAEIEDAKEDIIDYILFDSMDDDIDGDVIYDAIERFVELEDEEYDND